MRLEAALHASHAADDSRASQRAWRVLGSLETNGQLAILKVTDESAFHIMLSDFSPH